MKASRIPVKKMGYEHPFDTVRVVGASVYGILGTAVMAMALLMYRHDQKNKRAVYIARYQSYINTVSLVACSMWILCVGKLLPMLDLLEHGSPHRSRYGWWIAYAFYMNLITISLSGYHRITIFGIILACLMTIFSSISTVFLSSIDSVAGWALFSVTAGLSLIFAHFFIWWKSNRDYNSGNRVQARGLFSYPMADRISLVLSAVMELLILCILILSDEVTHVIGELASEICNVFFVCIHWSVIVFAVFFWYMDVSYSVGTSTVPTDQARNFISTTFIGIEAAAMENTARGEVDRGGDFAFQFNVFGFLAGELRDGAQQGLCVWVTR